MLVTADKHPEILHSMDIWRKAKLLKKVLNNVSCKYVAMYYNNNLQALHLLIVGLSLLI